VSAGSAAGGEAAGGGARRDVADPAGRGRRALGPRASRLVPLLALSRRLCGLGFGIVVGGVLAKSLVALFSRTRVPGPTREVALPSRQPVVLFHAPFFGHCGILNLYHYLFWRNYGLGETDLTLSEHRVLIAGLQERS
jgi:hypothetical protein